MEKRCVVRRSEPVKGKPPDIEGPVYPGRPRGTIGQEIQNRPLRKKYGRTRRKCAELGERGGSVGAWYLRGELEARDSIDRVSEYADSKWVTGAPCGCRYNV